MIVLVCDGSLICGGLGICDGKGMCNGFVGVYWLCGCVSVKVLSVWVDVCVCCVCGRVIVGWWACGRVIVFVVGSMWTCF